MMRSSHILAPIWILIMFPFFKPMSFYSKLNLNSQIQFLLTSTMSNSLTDIKKKKKNYVQLILVLTIEIKNKKEKRRVKQKWCNPSVSGASHVQCTETFSTRYGPMSP